MTNGLNGFVGIAPTIGGVIINGSDTDGYDFNFVPGSIIEINANPLADGSNDFMPFVGYTGLISDITAEDIDAINAGDEFANFLNVPDAFSFTLEAVDTLVLVESAFSTTAQMSAFGSFYDVNGLKSSGELNFSADFAGMTSQEVATLVSSDNTFVASWSLNAVANGVGPDATDIPDASLGFISIVLIVLALLARR